MVDDCSNRRTVGGIKNERKGVRLKKSNLSKSIDVRRGGKTWELGPKSYRTLYWTFPGLPGPGKVLIEGTRSVA